MSMSKRRESQQQEIWVPTHTLPETPSHPFYTQLNRLLEEHGFDSFVEEQCAPYCQDVICPVAPVTSTFLGVAMRLFSFRLWGFLH